MSYIKALEVLRLTLRRGSPREGSEEMRQLAEEFCEVSCDGGG